MIRGLWPDGAFNGTIGRTIVFSAEDDLEDTIVARLIAQKADLTNVTVCRRIREMNESGEMTRRGFNLARDLPHLERLLDTCPDTRLVIDRSGERICRQDRYPQERGDANRGAGPFVRDGIAAQCGCYRHYSLE